MPKRCLVFIRSFFVSNLKRAPMAPESSNVLQNGEFSIRHTGGARMVLRLLPLYVHLEDIHNRSALKLVRFVTGKLTVLLSKFFVFFIERTIRAQKIHGEKLKVCCESLEREKFRVEAVRGGCKSGSVGFWRIPDGILDCEGHVNSAFKALGDLQEDRRVGNCHIFSGLFLRK